MTGDKITVTLAQIRAQSPCEPGYRKLVKKLGGVKKYGEDTPISFKQIYKSNGYDDMLWCICAAAKEHDGLIHHFACDCAEMVSHLMTDERSVNAIKVARDFADGKANSKDLDVAWLAARGVALAAARTAALAADWAAARVAAWATAAAANAAGTASANAAATASANAAEAVAKDAQVDLWFEYCRLGRRPENSAERLKQLYQQKLNESKDNE